MRQAQSRTSQAIENYVEVERSVIAQTRGAYAAWRANEQIIAATQQAVSANGLSLEGVRAENSVGTRSILDILNAEQEYLNTQVQLVSAQRNSYVAAFSVLAAMGKAEARDLGIEGGALYDPEVNYQPRQGPDLRLGRRSGAAAAGDRHPRRPGGDRQRSGGPARAAATIKLGKTRPKSVRA